MWGEGEFREFMGGSFLKTRREQRIRKPSSLSGEGGRSRRIREYTLLRKVNLSVLLGGGGAGSNYVLLIFQEGRGFRGSHWGIARTLPSGGFSITSFKKGL